MPVSCQGLSLSPLEECWPGPQLCVNCIAGLAVVLCISVPRHLISGMPKELKMSWIRNCITSFVCICLPCDVDTSSLEIMCLSDNNGSVATTKAIRKGGERCVCAVCMLFLYVHCCCQYKLTCHRRVTYHHVWDLFDVMKRQSTIDIPWHRITKRWSTRWFSHELTAVLDIMLFCNWNSAKQV